MVFQLLITMVFSILLFINKWRKYIYNHTFWLTLSCNIKRQGFSKFCSASLYDINSVQFLSYVTKSVYWYEKHFDKISISATTSPYFVWILLSTTTSQWYLLTLYIIFKDTNLPINLFETTSCGGNLYVESCIGVS